MSDMDLYVGPERRRRGGRFPDTTALVAGVLATIGLTLLLLSFGGALGINVAAGSPDGVVSTEFGTWAFVSAVLGTLGGCLVGGLMSVRHSVSSAITHGIAVCSGALAVGALLGALGVTGLTGAAFAFTNEQAAAITSIAWGGWALFVTVIASFAVAVVGWMAGLALQPRASRERRIEEHRFVRPEVRQRGRTETHV